MREPSAVRVPRGEEYFRCCDHTLLARLVDGQLLSAQSGEPIAYQHDRVFYDSITRQPVYYVSSERLAPASRLRSTQNDIPAPS